MIYLGTHNSGTGEKGKGLLDWLLTPFARTQTKTILEQYEAGSRYFDIRLSFSAAFGSPEFRHGLWKSAAKPGTVFEELHKAVEKDNIWIYLMVTYEGELPEKLSERAWVRWVKKYFEGWPRLVVTEICVKKPKWKTLWKGTDCPPYRQGYKNLDGSDLGILLPIPWLWNIITKYPRKDGIFTFIDFI